MEASFRKSVALNVGQRLRQARRKSQMSLAALARRSGITARRLQRLEVGVGRITVRDLESVAIVLRLLITHFLDGCALCGGD
jgi:transcriptional regulator with XRE-family HTH domain